ncbi:MAG: hypothetical protein AAFY26_25510, partial [Cyanobacteria bacterium J06638_22]
EITVTNVLTEFADVPPSGIKWRIEGRHRAPTCLASFSALVNGRNPSTSPGAVIANVWNQTADAPLRFTLKEGISVLTAAETTNYELSVVTHTGGTDRLAIRLDTTGTSVERVTDFVITEVVSR